jgi:hypothetical protein
MTNVDLLLTPALTLVAVAGCHDGVAAPTMLDENGAYFKDLLTRTV